MKKLFIITLILFTASAIFASERSDSTRLYFRQSHGSLEETFGGNRERLDSMAALLRYNLDQDSVRFRVSGVEVVGGASPEGTVKINETLSRLRANTIFDYFSPLIPGAHSETLYSFLGRDWKGLRTLVEKDPEVPYRTEVLETLDRIIAETADGEKENSGTLTSLKHLRDGVPYRYMYTRLFPALRESRLYIRYQERQPELRKTLIEPFIAEDVTEYTGGIFSPELPAERCCRPFYMGLKTNMLYDLLALPSIGAEFYLGRNFSLGANWTYGWWDSDRRHRYWRAYGGDVTLRWWFGKAAHEKPLTGHHLGVYGGVLTYDFEWGGTGYMGGLPGRSLWDRCLLNAGVEYGYSLPVARRLNIDFTIGFGFLDGKYLKYAPKGNKYVWQSTHRLNWFGPTKAEVSLVWLIGCDNYNRQKGGMK